MRCSRQDPFGAGGLPAAPVPSGRRFALYQRAHRRGHRASAVGAHRLAGPGLLAAGHAVGLPGASPQRRPLVPRRCRPPDRPPRGAGATPCSPETGAYCQARKRLPESFFADVARHTGRALEEECRPAVALERAPRLCLRWLLGHHAGHAGEPGRVPAADTQKPGLGFPLARIAASSRSPAGRSWTWASAATPARGRASWACSAPCWACSAPATSCSPTG